jgi:hypothetical protein
LILLGISLALLAAPGRAAAVCTHLIGDPLYDPDAPLQVVFDGTAEDVASNSQNALFHVQEVWYGGPVREWVPVLSDPEGLGFWEDAPEFEQGASYLVVATRHRKVLISATCGATRAYADNVRATRPATVSSPEAALRPLVWDPANVRVIPWASLAVAGLFVAAFLGYVRLRRRVPHGPPPAMSSTE